MANFYVKYPQNGVPIYPTFAAFPVTTTQGNLAVAQDTGIVYEFFMGAWIPISNPSDVGTVTSVGLADGSSTPIYTISGSPVTTAGTLTFTLANQSANTVFAGPATGAAAQPTFRALVNADIPTILSLTALNIIGTAGSGVIDLLSQSAPPSAPASGHQLLYSDSVGRLTFVGSNGFSKTLTAQGLTASQVYSFPNLTGIVALSTGTATPQMVAVTNGSSPYTVGTVEALLLIDTSGGAVTVNLPNPNTNRLIRIKDSTGNFGTNNVTIHRFASEMIEGLASDLILSANWGSYMLQSNGTNWFKL